jgi:hypothetical protein
MFIKSQIWMVFAFVAVGFYEGGYRFADENYLKGLLITSFPFVVIGIFLTRGAIKEEKELERQQRELERRQRSEEELERRQRSKENMKTGGKADG